VPTLAEILPLRPSGVSDERIKEAEAMLGHALPVDVVEFWSVSDGSDWVAFPDFSIQVLSLAEAIQLWRLGPQDRAGAQRLVDIASDGSRERFCFDPNSGQIVLIDITWDQEEPDAPCAATLTDVVNRLAEGWNPLEGP
jgi:cell wall assembly regulator SMI1